MTSSTAGGQPGERRVLFVSHDGSHGGAQLSLLGLVAQLPRDRYTPIVAVPSHGWLHDQFRAAAVEVVVCPIARWCPDRHLWGRRDLARFVLEWPSRQRVLRALIRKKEIGLVYTNTIATPDGAWAARACRVRHVWHVREFIGGNTDLRSYLPVPVVRRLILGLSARVIANSRSLARAFGAKDGDGTVSVVYNGIDCSPFAAPAAPPGVLQRELEVPPATLLVGTVGYVTPRKDVETFLQTARSVADQRPDVMFLWIGTGHHHHLRHFRERATHLGLDRTVRFLGYRPDLERLLASLDVFMFCSRQEAFGRVIVEAMAAARPVVAARSGGPEEIVVDGETGVLVPIGDVAAFARAAMDLLADPGRAQRLGGAGQRRAWDRFGIEAYARGVEKVLDAVAERR